MTLAELGDMLDSHALAEEMNGALMLVERPDRWYDDPHWRCVNDHVSLAPVQGWTTWGQAEWSFQLCPICNTLVRLTFPEDVTGPLKPAQVIM